MNLFKLFLKWANKTRPDCNYCEFKSFCTQIKFHEDCDANHTVCDLLDQMHL